MTFRTEKFAPLCDNEQLPKHTVASSSAKELLQTNDETGKLVVDDGKGV